MVLVGVLVTRNDANRLDSRIEKLRTNIEKLSDLIDQGILNLNIKAGEDDSPITLLG